MTKKLTWFNWADEAGPDVVIGLGFCIVENTGYSITVDVYDVDLHEPEKPSRMCTAHVKWDGCSHINQNQDTDCWHLCGFGDWEDNLMLIREGVFKLAAEHMEHFNAEVADYKPGRELAVVKNVYMPEEIA